MGAFPTPTDAERAAPGFRLPDWALHHGLCPITIGEHDFGTLSFCQHCGEERKVLVRMARDGAIYAIARKPTIEPGKP